MPDTLPYLSNALKLFTDFCQDFTTPTYLTEERNYKVELSGLAQEQLSQAAMAEGIQQGRFTELTSAAQQIFKHSKNNIPSTFEKTVIGNIEGEQAEPFVRALYEYLYGDEPWTERLAQFAVHFKQITGKKATWPHLTLLPFLLFPTEHIILKPDAMRKAAEVLGFQWDYKSSPDLNTYQQFQGLARLLLPKLQPLGAKDMIDVQSFLWIVAGAAPNYWRIMPGKDAKYWEQFREFGRISAGWEDIGSLTTFTSKIAIKESLGKVSDKSNAYINAVTNQLDALRKMVTGNVVFVYGHSSILGVGRIDGDYIYHPEEWPPGSGDINNQHQYPVRWLALEQKGLEPLPQKLRGTLQQPRTVFDLSQQEAQSILETLYPQLLDGSVKSQHTESRTDISDSAINQLDTFVSARGFQFPQTLLTTYYLSLQTKPFVILTGISGTGKTKLAQLFAEWMSPSVVEKRVEKEVPTDGDDVFYLEVKPYYFNSGFVIPVRAYNYFDVPPVGNTSSFQVQLGQNKALSQVKFRNQQHTNGNTYVYFYSNDAIKSWFNENFNVGDLLAVRVVKENQLYRFERFNPTEKKLMKQKPRHVFLSVRPDWTDNRGLLGFYNLISQNYQTTDFMRLLTQAAIEPDAPHFVILDEMNLAKVEYYFADFLSVLESRYVGNNDEVKQEMLRLHDLPRCVLARGETPWNGDADLKAADGQVCQVHCAGCPLRSGVNERYWLPGGTTAISYAEARQAGFNPASYVPPQLAVPLNIYFTGTVNVDETTYMFSPKVLDRANTIEFNDVNLNDYFVTATKNDGETPPASESLRQQFTLEGHFLQFPKKKTELRSISLLAPYRQRLVELNKLLIRFTLHFGYRVADEVLLYLWHAHNLAVPGFDLDIAFDHQLYQKILPKFHGSEAKLREPLKALQTFCESHGCLRSLAKVERMLNQLDKEGFASFA